MTRPSVPPSDEPAFLRVQCPGCSVAYKIKEKAIASFPAVFTCKKCGHRIRIEAPAALPVVDPAPEPVQPVVNGVTSSSPPAVPPAPAAAVSAGAAPAGPDELALFIGRNVALYQQRFRKFTAFESSEYAPTWHWPAFFVPWLWFLYRKLYLWSLIAFVTGLIPLVNWAARIGWGMTAHYLYYKHARKKIMRCKEISELKSNMPLNQALRKKGGVHQWVWGFSAVPLIGILAAIAIPQFQVYRTRAYDTQARAAVEQVLSAQQNFFRQNHQYADSFEQLQDAGLTPNERPDVVVALLGSGQTDFYVEGFHSRGNQRFAACAAGGEVTVLPKRAQEIFGPDRAYKLAMPDGWQQVKDLNDAAEVQIAQARKDCFVIVLAEKQEDVQVADLADYSALARGSILDNLLQAEARKTGLDSINHRVVVQYEIRGALPDNRVPVVYLHTAVQGNGNYYQIIAWTAGQDYQANQSALKSIVNHFQEM